MEASDLEAGESFTACCAAFCDARVKLLQKSFLLSNAKPEDPKPEDPNAGS